MRADALKRRVAGLPTAFIAEYGDGAAQRLRAIHPYLGIGSLPAVNHQPAFAAATVTPAADRAVRDGAVLLAQTAIDAVLTPTDASI